MKIAVTGATGFLGRHVLRALARRPQLSVVAAATSPALLESGVQVIRQDLDLDNPGAHDELGRPDAVIHLAWGGLPNYQSNHHFESELPRQYRYLSGLIRGGLQSLVVAGTCFEYGMRNGELVEDMSPLPSNAYAFAKDALRQQLQFLQLQQPFRLRWARLFYMFGEGQGKASLYPQLLHAHARGDKTFPMSGGEQLRDYLPVEAVADLLVDLATHQTAEGLFNVCSGRPISVRRLVAQWIVAHNMELSMDLGHFPYAAHEPMAFWGSAERLRHVLASEPARP